MGPSDHLYIYTLLASGPIGYIIYIIPILADGPIPDIYILFPLLTDGPIILLIYIYVASEWAHPRYLYIICYDNSLICT